MILALAGGVGGAKLARGLADVLAPEALTIAVNTGDDFEHLEMHISPDLDSVMYALAGLNDPVRGWGIVNETWHFMHGLEALGGETWFRLGDRDLATHVERTRRLRAGENLSTVTHALCARLGIRHAVTPMSDDPVRTRVHTAEGVLSFQDYFVRRRAEPAVTGLEFSGAANARIANTLRVALDNPALRAMIICPSNPYLSIGPMLAIPPMRSALENRRVPVIAVSPIVAGQALKGPAAKIMRELGKDPSSLEVARFYAGLIDLLVVDHADAGHAAAIERLGIRVRVTATVMNNPDDRPALAGRVIDFIHQIPTPVAIKAKP
ncbi:MAG: 2-phospho-L-lactate transferase [Burkholderiales bacterium]